jgi:hypothetical protein
MEPAMRARTKQDVTMTTIRDDLTQVLDALPPAQQIEVLDFARFLQHGTSQAEQAPTLPATELRLRAVSPETLVQLTGIVRLGGDAVADTEALYDDNDRN